MYQNFVEIQLENQRKEEIKRNAEDILKHLSSNRCPVCTLVVPCKHYSVEQLLNRNEEIHKQELSKEIARQKALNKKNNSKESLRNYRLNRTNYFSSHNKMRMFSPENSKQDIDM